MTRTSCLALLASAALVGCSAGPDVVSTAPDGPIALGALGPSASAPTGADDGLFYFGAGDAIGQEVFTYYVACLRLNEHYATGVSDFPTSE